MVATGRDTFIATNVAHEGIDLTRSFRDNTWFTDTTPTNHSDWMQTSGICEDTGKHTYTVDPTMVRNFVASKAKVRNSAVQMLYIQGNSLWTHTVTSKPTGYRRVLEADCAHVNDTPAYVTITSTVSWTGQNGATKNVSIKELLYNWL